MRAASLQMSQKMAVNTAQSRSVELAAPTFEGQCVTIDKKK